MFLYGIGHAMTDYYFRSQTETTLPQPLQFSHAVHIEPKVFTSLLEQLRRTDGKTECCESGGTCVNMLKTASALGANTFFSGTVGGTNSGIRDKAALFFQKRLAGAGVESNLFLRNTPTGRCLIVDGSAKGQAIAASPGAAQQLDETVFDTSRALAADAIIIEGMILANTAITKKICSVCKTAEIPLVIAAATPIGARQININQQYLKEIKQVVLFANRTEADYLSLTFSSNGHNGKEAVLAVITDGEKGACTYTCNNTTIYKPESIVPQNEVESTGAGDVFAGAFLYKWLYLGKKKDEFNLKDCLVYAHSKANCILHRPLCPADALRQR